MTAVRRSDRCSTALLGPRTALPALPHCTAALLHCCTAALLLCCPAALLHCCTAALWHCSAVESPRFELRAPRQLFGALDAGCLEQLRVASCAHVVEPPPKLLELTFLTHLSLRGTLIIG